MKHRVLLGSGFIVAMVVLIALYSSSGNNATSVTRASSNSTNSSTLPAAQASDVSRILVTSDMSSPLINRGADSIASVDKSSASTTSASSWKRAVSSLSLEETALSLLSSDDPNDWLRAVSLHTLCISGFDRSDLSPNRVVQLDATFGHSFRKVASYFSARCGELGGEFLSRVSDVQSRAVTAKAPLALAPSLTNSTISQGLSDDQFKQLADLFADNDAATLWLTRNLRNLDVVLRNADGFNGATREDLQAASVIALCLRGLDCGQDSVVSLKLCANTTGNVCSEGGPLSALQQMDAERSARINAAAQRIDAALSQGNPAALGIRRRNS